MQSSLKNTIYLVVCLLFICTKIHAQNSPSPIILIESDNKHWVDSVYNSLSAKEKLGQLFMVPAYSDRDKASYKERTRLIKTNQIGGIVFFQGTPEKQAVLTNRYQSLLKVPALVAMDAEWGLGMRLDNTVSYPYQMTLGAIIDNELIYQMGQQIAEDFERLGMQLNFAPVIDVNNNINNPVINYRSFGENKYNVAAKGIAYMNGLQDAGIMATGKHFPGHGDTDVDSHKALPQLPFSRERLDSLELYPFKKLINAGLGGMMVAHMNIPALDETPGLPSTLSKPIITGLLKDELGFKGLVFTDAMNMKGVTSQFPTGTAELMAFMAGDDMIVMSNDVSLAINSLEKALQTGVITWRQVEDKVKRILTVKKWTGLNDYKPVQLTNIKNDLNSPKADELNKKLAAASLTLLRYQSKKEFEVPNQITSTAVLSIGSDFPTAFQRSIASKQKITKLVLSADASISQINKVKQSLKEFDRIIVGIHDQRLRPRSTVNFTDNLLDFIENLSKENNTSFAVMANAYTLNQFKGIENARILVVTYQNSTYTQNAAAKFFNNELKPIGKLPVTVNSHFKMGDCVPYNPKQ